jgi:hypothetical protein
MHAARSHRAARNFTHFSWSIEACHDTVHGDIRCRGKRRLIVDPGKADEWFAGRLG